MGMCYTRSNESSEGWIYNEGVGNGTFNMKAFMIYVLFVADMDIMGWFSSPMLSRGSQLKKWEQGEVMTLALVEGVN